MPQQAERRVSVALDADLVVEIEATGENLSASMDKTLRDELTRRRRHHALGALLDRLDAEEGPLGLPGDETEIARYIRLLSGPDVTPVESSVTGGDWPRTVVAEPVP